MTAHHQPHRSAVAVLLAVILLSIGASVLLFGSQRTDNDPSPAASSFWLRNTKQQQRRNLAALALSGFADPKSVDLRADSPDEILAANRLNCQIVYTLGVEGSIHHGFAPIIGRLRRAQNAYFESTGDSQRFIYPMDKIPIGDESNARARKRVNRYTDALYKKDPTPEDVQRLLVELCPPDGNRHVIAMTASFPAGNKGRDKSWRKMPPEEIAQTDSAMNNPINLYKFYDDYSRYADVQFIVLHRPYVEAIASHSVAGGQHWDGGAWNHANVISGFIHLLKNFLESHVVDHFSEQRLWTLVCTQQITSKYFSNEEELKASRANMLKHVASFLKWPVGECEDCFDEWNESTKDTMAALGNAGDFVLEHAKKLEGVWPPVDEAQPSLQCGV